MACLVIPAIAQFNLTLRSNVTYPSGLNDIWGWVDEDTVIDPDTGRVNIAGMLGPEHSGQGPGSRDGSFGLSEFGLSEFDINELQAARLYLRYRNNNIKRPNIFQRIYQFIRNLFKK